VHPKSRYFIASLLLSSLLFTTHTHGTDTTPPSTAPEKKPLHYVTSTAVDFATLLPAPPGPDTEEGQADLHVVLRVQKHRTDAQVARAQSESKLKMTAFTPVLGDWFTPENLPLTDKLLESAASDSKYFSAAAKDHFARKRPPNDARIKPKIDGEDEPSYPSGHATRGILLAMILSEMAPAQHEELMARGREIGWDRVIAGVHYPSDVIAGRVLGQALMRAMAADTKFKDELAAAKAEFNAAKPK
jgi:acid phosphatase (class A)